jgi:hypothetical protein
MAVFVYLRRKTKLATYIRPLNVKKYFVKDPPLLKREIAEPDSIVGRGVCPVHSCTSSKDSQDRRLGNDTY